MLAPWKARQEAKALAEQAQGQVNAIQIIEGARNRARNELISQPYSAHWEMDVGSSISQRIQYQEEKRQRNIESVVRQAAEELENKSVPDEEPDHDWTARFFNEVQDVSSDEMQRLWARILAGEVERPGTASFRTLGILKNLTHQDSLLFSNLCSFTWRIQIPQPLILDESAEIYKTHRITYGLLTHLETLGLIKQVEGGSLAISNLPKSILAHYGNRTLEISFPRESGNTLSVGKVMFTSAGVELATVVEQIPIEGLYEYVRDVLTSSKELQVRPIS